VFAVDAGNSVPEFDMVARLEGRRLLIRSHVAVATRCERSYAYLRVQQEDADDDSYADVPLRKNVSHAATQALRYSVSALKRG
jgi:hypothetical protein